VRKYRKREKDSITIDVFDFVWGGCLGDKRKQRLRVSFYVRVYDIPLCCASLRFVLLLLSKRTQKAAKSV
jgi:hypothetical protein